MKPIQTAIQYTLQFRVVVYTLLFAFPHAVFASDGPTADVWLYKGSKEPLVEHNHSIPPLHTSKGAIPPACLGMMLGMLPWQRDQMIGSVFIQDNMGRGCFRANDTQGIVRFDHIEYEVAEVEENNTYKLIFHALEWTGVVNEGFVIPTYKLTVRFERQPYTQKDNTVVHALVAVNLGAW